MAIWKGTVPITNLGDWRVLAKPKRDYQWAQHRSAMEVGRAWLTTDEALPAEVVAALASHPDFGQVLAWSAEPEVRLAFDDIAGEPRNTDLLVEVRDNFGNYLLAVEAKADEPFGDSLAMTRKHVDRLLAKGSRTNRWRRLEQLVAALLGRTDPMSDSLAGLRYQLFTACAGVLCAGERQGHDRVVMLVHEFVTPRTLDRNHIRNAADFEAFIKQIAGRPSRPNGLVGPITVPGHPLLQRPPALYIGKVSRNLR